MAAIFRIGLWVVKFRGGRQSFIGIIDTWRSQQVRKVQFYHWDAPSALDAKFVMSIVDNVI